MAMTEEQTTALVRDLMTDFAARTGLTGEGSPRRYLWTDAFAVCTFLALERRTRDDGYRALALRLVDQVHHVLGRHRADDPRSGWLSGLGAVEGARHPTRGGLRIGKPFPEREADEPMDERLEWERDGQYSPPPALRSGAAGSGLDLGRRRNGLDARAGLGALVVRQPVTGAAPTARGLRFRSSHHRSSRYMRHSSLGGGFATR